MVQPTESLPEDLSLKLVQGSRTVQDPLQEISPSSYPLWIDSLRSQAEYIFSFPSLPTLPYLYQLPLPVSPITHTNINLILYKVFVLDSLQKKNIYI